MYVDNNREGPNFSSEKNIRISADNIISRELVLSKTNTHTVLTNIERGVLTNKSFGEIEDGGFEISDMFVDLYDVVQWEKVLGGADAEFNLTDLRTCILTTITQADNSNIYNFVNADVGAKKLEIERNLAQTIGDVSNEPEYSVRLPLGLKSTAVDQTNDTVEATLTHSIIEFDNLLVGKHSPAFLNQPYATKNAGVDIKMEKDLGSTHDNYVSGSSYPLYTGDQTREEICTTSNNYVEVIRDSSGIIVNKNSTTFKFNATDYNHMYDNLSNALSNADSIQEVYLLSAAWPRNTRVLGISKDPDDAEIAIVTLNKECLINTTGENMQVYFNDNRYNKDGSVGQVLLQTLGDGNFPGANTITGASFGNPSDSTNYANAVISKVALMQKANVITNPLAEKVHLDTNVTVKSRTAPNSSIITPTDPDSRVLFDCMGDPYEHDLDNSYVILGSETEQLSLLTGSATNVAVTKTGGPHSYWSIPPTLNGDGSAAAYQANLDTETINGDITVIALQSDITYDTSDTLIKFQICDENGMKFGWITSDKLKDQKNNSPTDLAQVVRLLEVDYSSYQMVCSLEYLSNQAIYLEYNQPVDGYALRETSNLIINMKTSSKSLSDVGNSTSLMSPETIIKPSSKVVSIDRVEIKQTSGLNDAYVGTYWNIDNNFEGWGQDKLTNAQPRYSRNPPTDGSTPNGLFITFMPISVIPQAQRDPLLQPFIPPTMVGHVVSITEYKEIHHNGYTYHIDFTDQASITLPHANTITEVTWNINRSQPELSNGIITLASGVKFRNQLVKNGFDKGEWIIGEGVTDQGKLQYTTLYSAPMNQQDPSRPPESNWQRRKDLYNGYYLTDEFVEVITENITTLTTNLSDHLKLNKFTFVSTKQELRTLNPTTDTVRIYSSLDNLTNGVSTQYTGPTLTTAYNDGSLDSLITIKGVNDTAPANIVATDKIYSYPSLASAINNLGQPIAITDAEFAALTTVTQFETLGFTHITNIDSIVAPTNTQVPTHFRYLNGSGNLVWDLVTNWGSTGSRTVEALAYDENNILQSDITTAETLEDYNNLGFVDETNPNNVTIVFATEKPTHFKASEQYYLYTGANIEQHAYVQSLVWNGGVNPTPVASYELSIVETNEPDPLSYIMSVERVELNATLLGLTVDAANLPTTTTYFSIENQAGTRYVFRMDGAVLGSGTEGTDSLEFISITMDGTTHKLMANIDSYPNVLFKESYMEQFDVNDSCLGDSYEKVITDNVVDDHFTDFTGMNIVTFQRITATGQKSGNFITYKAASGTTISLSSNQVEMGTADDNHLWIEVPVPGNLGEFRYVNYNILSNTYVASTAVPKRGSKQYLSLESSLKTFDNKDKSTMISENDKLITIAAGTGANDELTTSQVDKWYEIPEIRGNSRVTCLRHIKTDVRDKIVSTGADEDENGNYPYHDYLPDMLVGLRTEGVNLKIAIHSNDTDITNSTEFKPTYDSPEHQIRYPVTETLKVIGGVNILDVNPYGCNVWSSRDRDGTATINLHNIYSLTARDVTADEDVENAQVQMLLTDYKHTKDRIVRELLIAIMAEISYNETKTIQRITEHNTFATRQISEATTNYATALAYYNANRPIKDDLVNLASVLQNALVHKGDSDPIEDYVVAKDVNETVQNLEARRTVIRHYLPFEDVTQYDTVPSASNTYSDVASEAQLLTADNVFGTTGAFKKQYEHFTAHVDELENFFTVFKVNLQRLKLESEFRKESLPDSVLKAFRNTMSKLVTFNTDVNDFTSDLVNFHTVATTKPVSQNSTHFDVTDAETGYSAISSEPKHAVTTGSISAQAIFDGDITDAIATLGFEVETVAPASQT